MSKPITIELFKRALHVLDKRLEELPKTDNYALPLMIKAIGGFALLYHNVRMSGVTSDIDTLTVDYPDSVNEMIKEVSTTMDIADDWINNYNVMSMDDDMEAAVQHIENMLNAMWEHCEWEFNNIKLWVADLETLLYTKLIAAEDDKVTARAQDYQDMVEILRKLKCQDFNDVIEFIANLDIDLATEYPWNFERLAKTFNVSSRMEISGVPFNKVKEEVNCF